MDWYTLFKFAHILGTVLGVGGTTLAEIFSLKFGKDYHDNPVAETVLKTCYATLRWGLALLVFSGFGYLVLWRLNFMGPELFYSGRFLAKMTVVMILLGTSLLLNLKKINFAWGTAISAVSWYAAMVLGIWRTLEISYWGILFFYAAAVGLGYLFLQFLRRRLADKTS